MTRNTIVIKIRIIKIEIEKEQIEKIEKIESIIMRRDMID